LGLLLAGERQMLRHCRHYVFIQWGHAKPQKLPAKQKLVTGTVLLTYSVFAAGCQRGQSV